MHVEVFCVCESSSLHHGIHTLRGVYSRVNVKSLPHKISQLTLAFRIRLEPNEHGEHKYGLEIKYPDGKAIASFGPMTIVAPKTPERYGLAAGQFGIPYLRFEMQGAYQFVLTIDGQPAATSILLIRLLKT